MSNDTVAIAAVIMTGVLLSVIAWQLLAIARTAVARDKDAKNRQLHERLETLEDLHNGAHTNQH